MMKMKESARLREESEDSGLFPHRIVKTGVSGHRRDCTKIGSFVLVCSVLFLCVPRYGLLLKVKSNG